MARRSIVIGALVAFIAGPLALAAAAWTPDRPVESLEQRWAPPPSRFLRVDGLAVHLRDEGPRDDSHPLVLLHGTSSSLHTWDGWVPALEREHRVVRLDLPGAGLTGPFLDDDYGSAHYTRFVEDFLDRLEVKHATLVGNSMGGRIAWEIAVDRRERVDRLVLINARGYRDETGSEPIAVRIARLPLVGPMILEHLTPRILVESSIAKAYGDPHNLTPAVLDRYYELLLRTGNRRALLLQMEAESYADERRIETIAVPTLILWGRLDPIVPWAHAERFHRDIAGSRLVAFDRLGHVPQEEGPARTVKALEDFLGP